MEISFIINYIHSKASSIFVIKEHRLEMSYKELPSYSGYASAHRCKELGVTLTCKFEEARLLCWSHVD